MFNDAAIKCRLDSGHRVGFILRAHASGPARASDRPGAEAKHRDFQIAISELPKFHDFYSPAEKALRSALLCLQYPREYLGGQE